MSGTCDSPHSPPIPPNPQGLQECGLLEGLRRAIHDRLGGAREYVLHTNSVWSPNGDIALLVLARAADAASGAFQMLGSLFDTVHLGVK